MFIASAKKVFDAITGAKAWTVLDRDWRLLDQNRSSINILASGTCSSFSMQPKQSYDGVTWINIGAAITTKDALTAITGIVLPYFKLDVTSVVGGNLTVWVA